MNSEGKLPKLPISSRKRLAGLLEPGKGPHRNRERFRNGGENGIPILLAQRLADAARHNPGRVNALSTQAFDDLLSELPQPDTVPRQLRISFEDSPQIALRRIGIHAQQQIGRRKMKNAERVRLHNLRHVENAAQLVGRRRNTNREQSVTRFGGGYQMADRADAANPRHQRRHFGEGTPLAQLFETAKLGDVEARVRHFPLFVKMQRDLGVALDAGHWIDDDGSFLRHCLGSEARSGTQLGLTSCQQFADNIEDRVGRRRTSRNKNIHRHKFMNGPRLGQQAWHDLVRGCQDQASHFPGRRGHRPPRL